MNFISVETKNSGYLLNLRFSSRVKFQGRDSQVMLDPLHSLPVSDRSQKLETFRGETHITSEKNALRVYPLVI